MKKYLAKIKRRLYYTLSAYFLWWTKFALNRWDPYIIVITGSVGKTTMLNILEEQLGEKAHYSHNANSSFGLAFDVVAERSITNSRLRWLWLLIIIPIKSLYFKHSEQYYVAEVDADRPEEARMVAKWLKPNITLWVSSSASHAHNFDRLVAAKKFENVEKAVAHEYGKIAALTKDLVIFDSTEPLMKPELQDLKVTKRGLSSTTHIGYDVKPNKTRFIFSEGTFFFANPQPESVSLQLRMVIELMKFLKLETNYNLTNLNLPPGRSTYLKGKGFEIIDSSYNAHTQSMESMLRMVDAISHSKKVLVIGDIIEQGKNEAKDHTKLAALISSVKAQKYILVGKRTNMHTLPALEKLTKVEIKAFPKPKDALTYLQKNLGNGELVFFKGSQFLEGVIEQLLENPEDEKFLPRRGPAAAKHRQAYGLNGKKVKK